MYYTTPENKAKGLKGAKLRTLTVQLQLGADGMGPVCPTN